MYSKLIVTPLFMVFATNVWAHVYKQTYKIDIPRYNLDRIIPNKLLKLEYKITNTSDTPRLLSVVSRDTNECSFSVAKGFIKPKHSGVVTAKCKFSHREGDHFRFKKFFVNYFNPKTRDSDILTLSFGGIVGYQGSFSDAANKSYRKYPNSLTLHTIKSPIDINWKTPSGLLSSVLESKFLHSKRTKFSIGHTTVELNCTSPNGEKKRLVGGQSSQGLDQYVKYLKKGYGFSILLGPDEIERYSELDKYPLLTVAGYLQGQNEVEQDLDDSIWKKDLASTTTVVLSYDECEKLVDFFQEYKRRTVNTTDEAGNNYGFGADPLKFEGAGCATFAEAFLKIANLDGLIELMERRIHVPEKLFGNDENSVTSWKLFFRGDRMGRDNFLNRKMVTFPCPSKLHDEVRYLYFKNIKEVNNMQLIEKGILGESQAPYIVLKPKYET